MAIMVVQNQGIAEQPNLFMDPDESIQVGS
jgi:hypothetical protein